LFEAVELTSDEDMEKLDDKFDWKIPFVPLFKFVVGICGDC